MKTRKKSSPNQPTPSSNASLAFANDCTLKNYVHLRRKYPNEPIELSCAGDYRLFLDAKSDLEQFGIEADLLDQCLVFKLEAFNEISLRLMELLVERQEEKGGIYLVSSGKVIGDHLLDVAINFLLTATSFYNYRCKETELPKDLMALIRYRSGDPLSHRESRLLTRRDRAIAAAEEWAAGGVPPTCRLIAEQVGANASSVSRWIPGDKMKEYKETAERVYAAMAGGEDKAKVLRKAIAKVIKASRPRG